MAEPSAEQVEAERNAQAFRKAVSDMIGDLQLQVIELRTLNTALAEKLQAATATAPEGGT